MTSFGWAYRHNLGVGFLYVPKVAPEFHNKRSKVLHLWWNFEESCRRLCEGLDIKPPPPGEGEQKFYG